MPGFEVPTPEGADTHAHQLFDTQSQAGEHLAHLALQTLFQHHAGTAGRESGNILGLGLAFRNAYTLQQLNKNTAVECLVQRDPVFLFNTTARVRQVLAHAAVIREYEQTFAVCIQSAHIVGMAVLGGQQVIHRADGALGLPAANKATRLVEQNHHLLLRYSAAAIHLYEIGGHDTKSGGVHSFAIYLHSAFCNESVCSAAALVSAHGKKLIQAHAALGGGGVAVIFRHSRFLYTF